MFLGTSKHSIDAKNRIRIPALFKEMGNEFALVLGHGCINIFPKAAIEERLKAFNDNIDIYDQDELEEYRNYMMMIDFPKPDTQGRFVIDSKFIKAVGLGKDINVIGMGDHLEIVPYKELAVDKDSFNRTMAFMSKMSKKLKNNNNNNNNNNNGI